MKQLKKHQKGFSVVEGMLLVTIIGLVSFIGWYVWNSNNQASKTLDNAGQFNNAEAPKQSDSEVSIPQDWINYQNKNLGLSFAYPKSWTFTDHSNEPSETKSYYVGELNSEDGTTSVAIQLERQKDGRNVHSSVEDWKVKEPSYTNVNNTSNTKYTDLAEFKSRYAGINYIMEIEGVKGGLMYEILDPNFNIKALVIPVETTEKITIEKILNTVRFE